MRIDRGNVVYSMNKESLPVLELDAPCFLTFETQDCFSGQIECSEDTLECVDFERINPATGPVYFNDIKAGDVLAVHVVDIRVEKNGKMVTAPGYGVLGDMVTQAETKIVPIKDDHFKLHNVTLPVNPMIGVVGVAPSGDPINCGTPGNHGGNMDTKDIRKGSTLYLPVQVDGALLAIGDLHAAMGDGEIVVTGVEVSGEVDVKVSKMCGLEIGMPVVKSGNELSFVASEVLLDDAVTSAVKAMAEFLTKYSELTFNEACMLMSVCGDARISQVVDPLKTARFVMPLDVLKTIGVEIAF